MYERALRRRKKVIRRCRMPLRWVRRARTNDPTSNPNATDA
jgi:hypothetical protein